MNRVLQIDAELLTVAKQALETFRILRSRDDQDILDSC
nr:hypothetical protein [Plesiomonas shigelloides]